MYRDIQCTLQFIEGHRPHSHLVESTPAISASGKYLSSTGVFTDDDKTRKNPLINTTTF